MLNSKRVLNESCDLLTICTLDFRDILVVLICHSGREWRESKPTVVEVHTAEPGVGNLHRMLGTDDVGLSKVIGRRIP
jgi:hypothetical protein